MSPAEQAASTEPPYYASEEPPCFCTPSVPWDDRKYDGTYEEGSCEQRTCRECGASLSRVLA